MLILPEPVIDLFTTTLLDNLRASILPEPQIFTLHIVFTVKPEMFPLPIIDPLNVLALDEKKLTLPDPHTFILASLNSEFVILLLLEPKELIYNLEIFKLFNITPPEPSILHSKPPLLIILLSFMTTLPPPDKDKPCISGASLSSQSIENSSGFF